MWISLVSLAALVAALSLSCGAGGDEARRPDAQAEIGGVGDGAPPALETWTEPATGMRFVEIPPGRFEIGSPPDEPLREAQESRHPVELTRAYWIGVTEVTQDQWERVMKRNPSKFRLGGTHPVENVSWNDANEFLARLGELSPGNRFRLPTEAEWERACRAGTTTAFAWGPRLDAERANFDGAEASPLAPAGPVRGQTLPVATFPPNGWGLHDFHGNVWEWCADEPCPYPEGAETDPVRACGSELKVIRGGSWHFGADSARCALRYTHAPVDVGPSLGFRAVREPAG